MSREDLVGRWRVELMAAIAALALFAAGVYAAPGGWFVRFDLDVVPAPNGLTVVVQTRRAPVAQAFKARWTAEILRVAPDGVMTPVCEGRGEHSYTWADGSNSAALRLSVSDWVGDSECVRNLAPGETYFAEAAWTFWALGRDRSVTARSRTFIAQ